MLNSNKQFTYIFFKFRLLLWSLFNLQMYTHTCVNSSHFPFYFIWNNSQLFCLVNKNVGTCRKASQWKYVCACVYVCVHFFSETTGPMKPKFMWNHDRMGEERIQMIQVVCCSSLLSAPGRAGAFSRDFTTILAPECRDFNGALKIEKLKAPLIPGPKGPWIQLTGAL